MEDIYHTATQNVSDDQKKQAYKISGDCYLKMGIPNSALFQYEEAKKKDPTNPEFLNMIGICYQRLNQFDQAKDMYQKASDMDKGNGEYYYNLATVLGKLE